MIASALMAYLLIIQPNVRASYITIMYPSKGTDKGAGPHRANRVLTSI